MKAAAEGDLSLLTDLYETCIGCGRCEEACPQKIMIHSLIVKAGEKAMLCEDNLCRVWQRRSLRRRNPQRRQPNRPRRNPRYRCSRRMQQLSKRRQRRLRHMQRIRKQTIHRRTVRMLSHVRRQLPQQRRQNTLRRIPRRIRSWRSPQRRFMRCKQPHRRCSNQSSKHLRKTPTKRQLRRNRRLHPQPPRCSRLSLGCILTESRSNRRRILALRCTSPRRSTRCQIPTYAPWQKRQTQKTGKSSMHAQATKLTLDQHQNTSST